MAQFLDSISIANGLVTGVNFASPASADLAALSGPSRLLGSGSGSSAAGEVALGAGLSMTGSTLSATGGATGPAGPTGPAGGTGPAGATGANGTPGSVWRDGTGAPSNSLGADGDYYLNHATGDVYLRAAGTYSVACNIRGATGATGPTGAAGAPGGTGGAMTSVSVYVSGTTALIAGGTATVPYDAVTTDALSEFNTTAHTFTPANSGDYLVSAGAMLSGAPTPTRSVLAVWTGTSSELQRLCDCSAALAAGAGVVTLTAGTAYTIRVYTSASGTSIQNGATYSALKIKRLLP